MNIGEATAVNRLLRYVLRIPKDPEDRTPGPALVAAIDLADHAYKALGAGLTGDQVRAAFQEPGPMHGQVPRDPSTNCWCGPFDGYPHRRGTGLHCRDRAADGGS